VAAKAVVKRESENILAKTPEDNAGPVPPRRDRRPFCIWLWPAGIRLRKPSARRERQPCSLRSKIQTVQQSALLPSRAFPFPHTSDDVCPAAYIQPPSVWTLHLRVRKSAFNSKPSKSATSWNFSGQHGRVAKDAHRHPGQLLADPGRRNHHLDVVLFPQDPPVELVYTKFSISIASSAAASPAPARRPAGARARQLLLD